MQRQDGDRYFSAEQQQQMAELTARWRAARDASSSLPSDSRAELEALVDEELRAATDQGGRDRG